MGHEFELSQEIELAATPEQVWLANTVVMSRSPSTWY